MARSYRLAPPMRLASAAIMTSAVRRECRGRLFRPADRRTIAASPNAMRLATSKNSATIDRSGDQHSYSALNHDINDAIFEAATGNKALSATYNNLRIRLRSLRCATPPARPH